MGLALRFSAGADLPDCLLLDVARLRQVLVNLVGNAIKFTEKGGIAVTVERVPDAPAAAVPPSSGALALRFTVADTGIGIPEAFKPRLFGFFAQAPGQDHATYGGTGLGLAISQRLVRLMNGEISVADNPGGGAVFTLLLRKVPIVAAPSAREPVPAGSGARVSPAAGPAEASGPGEALDDGLEEEIAAVRRTLRIRQARALGERLLAAGARRGSAELSRLGEDLCGAAAAFQIDRMKRALEQAADFAARFKHGTGSEVRMKGHP